MEFGFTVVREEGEPERWRVQLPHQCGPWLIAADTNDDGVPHKEAIASLETFIAEAQQALNALRQRTEK